MRHATPCFFLIVCMACSPLPKPPNADAPEGPNAEAVGFCDDLAEYARTVMEARQQGLERGAIVERIAATDPPDIDASFAIVRQALAAPIIDSAFQFSVQADAQDQQDQADRFGALYRDLCLKRMRETT